MSNDDVTGTLAPAGLPESAVPHPGPAGVSLRELTHKPIITPVIIGLNVLIYIAMGITGVGWFHADARKALNWGADFWPLTTTGQWWRLLTSAFVHFGLLHIAFNMWALAQAGILTERLYGRRCYVLIYLYGALMSGLVSTWWDQGSISAGASGAIFAVFGAMLVYLIFYRDVFPPDVLKPLMNSTIICIGFNIYYGATNAGISNSAHIGGLFSGMLMGMIVARPLDPRRRRSHLRPRLFGGLVIAVLTLSAGLYALPKDYDRMLQYGVAYDLGEGMPQDYSKAMQWYRKASNGGNAMAAHNIAVMYLAGKGVPKDQTQAEFWFRRAADRGDIQAMDWLGNFYQFNPKPDYPTALKWYRRAAEGGDAESMSSIGSLYAQGLGVPQDNSQAMMWYRRSVAAGGSSALNNIGMLYEKGDGVQQDRFEAMQWFLKAASAGQVTAMRNVAELYEQGVGVEPDLKQAAMWYRKAAAGGDPEAAKWIADHPQNAR